MFSQILKGSRKFWKIQELLEFFRNLTCDSQRTLSLQNQDILVSDSIQGTSTIFGCQQHPLESHNVRTDPSLSLSYRHLTSLLQEHNIVTRNSSGLAMLVLPVKVQFSMPWSTGGKRPMAAERNHVQLCIMLFSPQSHMPCVFRYRGCNSSTQCRVPEKSRNQIDHKESSMLSAKSCALYFLSAICLIVSD